MIAPPDLGIQHGSSPHLTWGPARTEKDRELNQDRAERAAPARPRPTGDPRWPRGTLYCQTWPASSTPRGSKIFSRPLQRKRRSRRSGCSRCVEGARWRGQGEAVRWAGNVERRCACIARGYALRAGCLVLPFEVS